MLLQHSCLLERGREKEGRPGLCREFLEEDADREETEDEEISCDDDVDKSGAAAGAVFFPVA